MSQRWRSLVVKHKATWQQAAKDRWSGILRAVGALPSALDALEQDSSDSSDDADFESVPGASMLGASAMAKAAVRTVMNASSASTLQDSFAKLNDAIADATANEKQVSTPKTPSASGAAAALNSSDAKQQAWDALVSHAIAAAADADTSSSDGSGSTTDSSACDSTETGSQSDDTSACSSASASNVHRVLDRIESGRALARGAAAPGQAPPQRTARPGHRLQDFVQRKMHVSGRSRWAEIVAAARKTPVDTSRAARTARNGGPARPTRLEVNVRASAAAEVPWSDLLAALLGDRCALHAVSRSTPKKQLCTPPSSRHPPPRLPARRWPR